MANKIIPLGKPYFDPSSNQFFQLILIDNVGSYNLYVKDVPAPTVPSRAADINSSGATPVIAPSGVGTVDGVGTTGYLPLWTDGPNSIIGDSVLTQNTGSLIQPTGDFTLTLGDLSLGAGMVKFPANVRQTFTPGATTPGLNVGSFAGDPSTPANGDVWYNSTSNLLRTRINGVTISLTAGTGGTVTSVSVTTANGVSGSVATATTTPAITLTLGAITPSSVTASGAIQSGTVSVATGALKLANAASAFLTTIQAGNALAARTYTWPTDFGAAGSALTDAAGNGVLSWVAISAGTTINPTDSVIPQRSNATTFIDSPITGSVPGSMVDGVTITGAATANPATVSITATGSDTNINIALTPKGTGLTILASGLQFVAGSGPIVARSGAGGNYLNIGVNGGPTIGGSQGAQASGLFLNADSRDGVFWNTGNASSTGDLGITRNGAGIAEINNGTPASFRDLKLRNVLSGIGPASYYQLPPQTVAQLTAPATAGIALAFVTDAVATAITGLGLAVVGGGTNKVVVYSDGASWFVL